jgi:hypothetical protein
LKLEDTKSGMGGGQRTYPTEAARRRIKVAREGCREERVTRCKQREERWDGKLAERERAWKGRRW